ncbi:uncharacterized protein ACR2FA_008228 [Aphomia sociella]
MSTMDVVLRVVFFAICFRHAAFTDSPCVIELECPECIPDNMPLVTSHRSANGTIVANAGDEVLLVCSGGKFLAYPLRDTIAVVCERGRYRVRQDGSLKHLIELGCQENVFEDVLHEVEECGPPLQGRAYQTWAAGGPRHLATLCFDADAALLRRARTRGGGELRLRAHSHRAAPLSLLGNFNHMFDATNRRDAERLYSDDAAMTRRLRELLKHDRFAFADQTLTAARVLSPHYFDDQNMRVTEFASNKVAVWRSVAAGNLRHLQHDVALALRASRPHALTVVAGTHGVATTRAGGRRELFLRAGGRFPLPRYVWTVVHDARRRRALALVLLNDPFVAVSEIEESVFCESACGGVSWLRDLKRNRNYESPVYGLVFCCSLQNFTSVVSNMPSDIIKDLPDIGMLTDLND